MKTVFLHIGTHKTGSTSIQVFMDRAADSLAKQGVLYPRAGRSPRKGDVAAGHHVLAWYFLGKRNVVTDESWQALRGEVASWTGDRVVISTEGFQNITATHVSDIQDYLPGCDLHAVIYVRNPLALMLSAYKQRVKMGTYAGGFQDYLRAYVGRLDYGALVDRWASALGPERVHLRLFDKVKERPGLEADFCEVIGADVEPLRPFVDRPANVSPGEQDIAIMRRINRLTWWAGELQRRRGWPARLRAAVRRPGPKGMLVRSVLGAGAAGALVSPAEIDWLREAIAGPHEAFLERFVAPEDRDLLRF